MKARRVAPGSRRARGSRETLRGAHDRLRAHAADLERRLAERAAAGEEAVAEVDAFAYAVSHDLRAPLRAMQGFASALLEDCAEGLGPDGQEWARRIVAAARRMDAIIEDLLAYSRIGRAQLRLGPVSLDAVVKESLADLEGEIRERGAEIEVRPPLPGVRGHRVTLVKAVSNLLGNAVKFVPPQARPRVSVWAEERGDRVRLFVEDNGIGIAPEHQERIFRVFERLHGVEAYPGTGIGLAIVRKAAECMSGRAGVESREGSGSRFWIELPGEAPS